MNELLDNLLMEEWANQSLSRTKERQPMLQLQVKPGDKVLELGGGLNPIIRPNWDVRFCVHPDGTNVVDRVINFEEPLVEENQVWDAIFCRYALEHVSYPKIPQFLAEVCRILKPGGRVLFVVPNTAAQMEWLAAHPDGWDGKDYYTASSELLFGTLDYPENSHKAFFNPAILHCLFLNAGFAEVEIIPYNERGTDLVVQAVKPNVFGTHAVRVSPVEQLKAQADAALLRPQVIHEKIDELEKEIGSVLPVPDEDDQYILHGDLNAPKPQGVIYMNPPNREELFDKQYFNGGGKVGGYAREGLWDFPPHWATFRHIMDRHPSSVLELGCARGYILKKLQDAGIHAQGMEISKHCYLTRACNDIQQWDLCQTPWPINFTTSATGERIVLRDYVDPFDLCFSIATFEHIPQKYLPAILTEMKRVSKRGLHGIDFGECDDGFDKTHCTLRPYHFWRELFDQHGLQDHYIVDKENLEQGPPPIDVMQGDGKLKLNVGSFTTMSHFGWHNLDLTDQNAFAQHYGYLFRQHDVRGGLPYKTGEVDLIFCCHFLEHLTAREGVAFLRECRRVLKPTGALRIIVPDAYLLINNYFSDNLGGFDEISDGASACPSQAGKLWELLFSGHQFMYDAETLEMTLEAAGLVATRAEFRKGTNPGCQQIVRECIESHPCLSLTYDAVPLLA